MRNPEEKFFLGREPLSLYLIPQGCTGVLSRTKRAALATTYVDVCVCVVVIDKDGERISLSHADNKNYSKNFFNILLKDFNQDDLEVYLYSKKESGLMNDLYKLAQKHNIKNLKINILEEEQDAVCIIKDTDVKIYTCKGEFLLANNVLETTPDIRKTYTIQLYGRDIQTNPIDIDQYHRSIDIRSLNKVLCPDVEEISPLYLILTDGTWSRPMELQKDVGSNFEENWGRNCNKTTDQLESQAQELAHKLGKTDIQGFCKSFLFVVEKFNATNQKPSSPRNNTHNL